jgi:hypothetical protein
MVFLPEAQQVPLARLDTLVADFFRQSAGHWRSQRRYYTLKNGETQEVVSHLTLEFLDCGCEQLQVLAGLHDLSDANLITSGILTTWESNYLDPEPQRPTQGSSIFGVAGTLLYRDRGFATSKPVVAEFAMRDAQTMVLRTEYSGNVFAEEVKLIGRQHRTRQTVISRSGEEQMIGQYLETRLET